MGLFGLTAFTTARRKREIAIRKAMGASVHSIFCLLATDTLMMVAIAMGVATPVAYVVMSRWLEKFAYAVTISPTMFVAIGCIAALLAVGSISYHVFSAAVKKPISSLRESD